MNQEDSRSKGETFEPLRRRKHSRKGKGKGCCETHQSLSVAKTEPLCRKGVVERHVKLDGSLVHIGEQALDRLSLQLGRPRIVKLVEHISADGSHLGGQLLRLLGQIILLP